VRPTTVKPRRSRTSHDTYCLICTLTGTLITSALESLEGGDTQAAVASLAQIRGYLLGPVGEAREGALPPESSPS
jgi:hypothetical protein